MNFAIPHRKLPIKDIIASTEKTARSLDHRSAQQLRENVKSCLDKQQTSKPNLSKQQLIAISNLRKDDSIVILPADKGNSTVVMDKSTYQSKIMDILEDGSYRPLKKDPTLKLERTINRELMTLAKEGEIDDKLRPILCRGSRTSPC